MKHNFLFRTLIVVFVILWSLKELYPPRSKNLIDVFEQRASNTDSNFVSIIEKARSLQKEFPERTFGNLLLAIGTNDISRYFSYISVEGEDNPTRFILNKLQKEASGKIKLGLDLKGGTSFLVGLDTSKLAGDTNTVDVSDKREHALAQAVEVLRKRVDKLGVAEPLIQPAGSDKILISLPGLTDAENESAKRQIQKAAYLELRLVHPNSDELISQGINEPGYEVLSLKVRSSDKNRPPQRKLYLVKKKPELTGKYIRQAMVIRNPVTGEPQIQFQLNSEGARIFADVTRENINRELAIVLDGELYSAPVIRSEIPGGVGVIEGSFDIKDAFELANVLENPLETPVKILEERRVDPSLGADSIRSGITACIIGTIAVVLFMLVYYLICGLIADFAVMLNIIILLGVMCSIESTLTIPGIAGIVLTVGMAVDANVLIFERIREELQSGKSLKGAIAAGYDKAFGTIFDSNITTVISSIILYFFGTGSVKGFGVTLTIGIAASMFTALFVTRLIFDWLIEKGWLKSLPMLQLFKQTKIDFVHYAKPLFILSWTIILIGWGWGFYRGNNVFGVDFAGGDNLTLGFSKKIDTEKIRGTLKNAGISESLIQFQKDLATGHETLKLTLPFGTGDLAEQSLKKDFSDAGFMRLSLDTVGPTIGKEIQKSAVVAMLLSFLGILIYVAMRYEFSFAVGAIIALLHDVLITLGIFFISGRQLGAPMVAAILTIIGFSINDTIVIFDRIREDLRLGLKGSFMDIINKAVNQTLSRTVITSGTVFLSTMALYLFGGGVINDFAFAFLVGIITGTYSSIYIASAIVLWWHKGEKPKLAVQATIEQPVSSQA